MAELDNGNVAAMREALVDIVLLTVKAGKSISCDVACGIIASKAKHALATPPRNCDRFNTGDLERDAQDAMEAMLDECVAGYRTMAKYLLSPATEQKGEVDGSHPHLRI